MTEIRLKHADVAGLDAIASRLRASDREELDALETGLDARQAVESCVALSAWRRALWHGDIPLAVTGVVPCGDGTHAPWLVGTDDIGRFPLAFLRACRGIVRDVYRKHFAPLLNYVDARQERSIRFLRSLGFRVEDAGPLGKRNYLFCKFTLES